MFSLNSALHRNILKICSANHLVTVQLVYLVFFLSVFLRVWDSCRWHLHSACFLPKLEMTQGGYVTLAETVEAHRWLVKVESCVWLGFWPNPTVIPRCWLWVTVSTIQLLPDSSCIVNTKKIIPYHWASPWIIVSVINLRVLIPFYAFTCAWICFFELSHFIWTINKTIAQISFNVSHYTCLLSLRGYCPPTVYLWFALRFYRRPRFYQCLKLAFSSLKTDFSFVEKKDLLPCLW